MEIEKKSTGINKIGSLKFSTCFHYNQKILTKTKTIYEKKGQPINFQLSCKSTLSKWPILCLTLKKKNLLIVRVRSTSAAVSFFLFSRWKKIMEIILKWNLRWALSSLILNLRATQICKIKGVN